MLNCNIVVIDPGSGLVNSNLSFCRRLQLCIGSSQCILCKDPSQEAEVHECYLTIHSNFPFQEDFLHVLKMQ